MKQRDDFVFALEKIRYAVATSEKRDAAFAKDTALAFLKVQYAKFRLELTDAGVSGDHEQGLDTFEHAMDLLKRYFDGNPGGLSARDACVYGRYLQTEHEGFVALADEIKANH
ncbi:hypothetical protein ACQV2E_23660 [Pantoea allii]|uniref:Uncharacterized protein n=2 Tax=Pantoea allii TaxID=574096 RepID=A0ABS6VJ72_9GAMM|nr:MULTISPECIES: hypothetical protein [Pantoea]MBW1215867.1 hypothetical protein [Pantoea allii]MBW1254562.1 hypothetical protein [Pantoea allii]MBW1259389.1 hypothetical protein [Pantoea allii]MBW1263778.1 hypothetical protein [Pantoea allii]MBW1268565.1 hypothetical protein [Pantoea allii]